MSQSYDRLTTIAVCCQPGSIGGKPGYLPKRWKVLKIEHDSATGTYQHCSDLLTGSLADLAVQLTEVSSLAYIGVAAYIVLVAPQLNIKVNEADRMCYENRLAAESVKCLSWRYAVGRAPFEVRQTESLQATNELFSQSLSGVIRDAPHVPLPDPIPGTFQRTEEMRAFPGTPLETRIE